MTGFSAAWLALREPFDRAARSAALAHRFAAALPKGSVIADLGSGAGANVRYLAPLVTPDARFVRVDDDPELLALATRGEARRGDLSRDLERLMADANAVTSAALMDLVSAAWFDGLALRAAQRRWPLLLALSVDGRCSFDPTDPDDALIGTAFAVDQRRDKGFGRALGPEAPAYMRASLRDLGADVTPEASDWRIETDAAEMLSTFVGEMADAAARAAPRDGHRFALWRKRRAAQIAAGKLSVTVGHQDLLALW